MNVFTGYFRIYPQITMNSNCQSNVLKELPMRMGVCVGNLHVFQCVYIYEIVSMYRHLFSFMVILRA